MSTKKGRVMSRALFWMIFTPFGVLALVGGWIIGTPKPPNILGGVVPNHFVPFTAQAQSQPVSNSEAAQDAAGSGRAALAARVNSSLDQVEASPCDPAARAAFLDAFVQLSLAVADQPNAADGGFPPNTRTPAELKAGERVRQLIAAKYFTDDELGLAVIQKKLGKEFVAQQIQKNGLSGPMRSTRCST